MVWVLIKGGFQEFHFEVSVVRRNSGKKKEGFRINIIPQSRGFRSSHGFESAIEPSPALFSTPLFQHSESKTPRERGTGHVTTSALLH